MCAQADLGKNGRWPADPFRLAERHLQIHSSAVAPEPCSSPPLSTQHQEDGRTSSHTCTAERLTLTLLSHTKDLMEYPHMLILPLTDDT